MSESKKPIKIPPVLTQLGTVEKIETVDGKVFRWTVKQACGMFCAPTGNTIFCFLSIPKKAEKEEFERAFERNASDVEAGLKRYETWHEFDAKSGSLATTPRGFLFFAGRAKSIIYRSDKWVNRSRRYIHTFEKAPKIWVNRYQGPTLVTLTGGRIQITKDGIKG